MNKCEEVTGMNEKEERREVNLLSAATDGAAYETVQRYGSAAKEHYVAYSGQDNEAGQALAKSLKSISEEKVNPDYEYQNIHQQAGYSAEVKGTARTNAENIIKGDKTRKVRTDDQGRVNDPLYDTVLVDAEGNVVEGSSTQVKICRCLRKRPDRRRQCG
jgi:hypothetical protein